jgi:hypothetical protein
MTEPLFTGPSESATVAGTVATDGRALASTAAPPDPPSRVWAPVCEEPAPAGTAPGVTRKPPRLQRDVVRTPSRMPAVSGSGRFHWQGQTLALARPSPGRLRFVLSFFRNGGIYSCIKIGTLTLTPRAVQPGLVVARVFRRGSVFSHLIRPDLPFTYLRCSFLRLSCDCEHRRARSEASSAHHVRCLSRSV